MASASALRTAPVALGVRRGVRGDPRAAADRRREGALSAGGYGWTTLEQSTASYTSHTYRVARGEREGGPMERGSRLAATLAAAVLLAAARVRADGFVERCSPRPLSAPCTLLLGGPAEAPAGGGAAAREAAVDALCQHRCLSELSKSYTAAAAAHFTKAGQERCAASAAPAELGFVTETLSVLEAFLCMRQVPVRAPRATWRQPVPDDDDEAPAGASPPPRCVDVLTATFFATEFPPLGSPDGLNVTVSDDAAPPDLAQVVGELLPPTCAALSRSGCCGSTLLVFVERIAPLFCQDDAEAAMIALKTACRLMRSPIGPPCSGLPSQAWKPDQGVCAATEEFLLDALNVPEGENAVKAFLHSLFAALAEQCDPGPAGEEYVCPTSACELVYCELPVALQTWLDTVVA